MYTDYTEENNNENYYDESNNNNNNDKLKKIVFVVLIFVVALILIVVLAKSCSKNNDSTGGNNPTNQPISIAMNRTDLTLEVGEDFELFADVLFASASSPIVTWYSDDSKVAVVDDNGFVSAIAEGNTNIVAKYIENGKEYLSKCSITVTSKSIAAENIDIVQEKITLKKGAGVLLEISLTPSGANENNLVFSSDDTSIATVSSKGYINAIDYGTTTIRVKTENGQLSDTVQVSVTATGQTVINPVSLELTGISNGISVGKTATVRTNLLPANATNKTLTWSSSNPSVATVKDGVITGVSAGSCKIIATTSNGISSSIDITVQSNQVSVSGITITNGTNITMNTSETKLINYTITPNNATNKKVMFLTSNSNVVYVSSNGVMAAISAGNAVVTVVTDDGRKEAKINITVVGETNSGTGSSNSTGSESSSGSSGGSSSSGSGSGSSGGSSSSGSSGGSSSTASCDSASMVTIEHNGTSYGAVVSLISFKNAKVFTGMSTTPTISVKAINDCLDKDRILYHVYYGTSESNVDSTSTSGYIKSDTKIKLDKDGYYKIKITGFLPNSNDTIVKYYYAIVSNNSDVAIKATYKYYDYQNEMLYVDLKGNNLSNSRRMYYCTTTGTSCTPNTNSKYTTTASTVSFKVQYGQKMCFALFVDGTKKGDAKCIDYAKSPKISVTPNIVDSKLKLVPKLIANPTNSAKIYYRVDTSISRCVVNVDDYPISSGDSRQWAKSTTAKYVCFQAIDTAGNRSKSICYDLKNQKVVV